MSEATESYCLMHEEWVKTMRIQADGLYRDIEGLRELLKAKETLLLVMNDHIIISHKTFKKWQKDRENKS